MIYNILIKHTNNNSENNKLFWYDLLNNKEVNADIPYKDVGSGESFILDTMLILNAKVR